jgi:hypothetical protein
MKNISINPVWIIIGGFMLVLTGAAIPWLIVLRFIPSTIFLNFFSFGCTVLGLLLGIVGTAYLVTGRRK